MENKIELTDEEAQDYLNKFFENYPGVDDYMKTTQSLVKLFGVTHTFTGHRRHFPELKYNQGDRGYQARVGRQAVNARVQTTSSILVNYNLICLAKAIRKNGWDGRVLLTVHDSIAFQLDKNIPKADIKKELDYQIVTRIEEEFPWLPVPWAYDCGWGNSYGTCKNSLE